MKRTKHTEDQQIRTFASALVARAALMGRLGQQTYDGDRNLYEALGYKTQLTWSDYIVQYSRQDIAQAIINRPANATWKGDLVLQESNEADQTNFEKKWIELEKRLSLKTKFKSLDKLTCLGQYSVLLLGFDDIANSDGFRNPVKNGKKDLLYVRPVGEGNAEVQTWVKDTTDPRYGLPLMYTIELAQPGEENTTTSLSVHYSRVMHVVFDQLDSEVEGTPVLKAAYNRLMDLEKLIGGSAEMFWRGARPGYQGKVDPDFTLTSDMEDDLKDQIDEFEHKLRRIIINEGVSFEELKAQIDSPKEHVEVQMMMISALTGIPKRILMGTERGELSSSQDEDTWFTLIQGRREDFAEPKIIRPFVEICQKYDILPITEEEWNVRWADLFSKSEKDKAEVGRIRSTALREYTLNPYAVEVVPPESFFEFFLGLDRHQISLIQKMADQFELDDSKFQETPEETEIRKQNEKAGRRQTNPSGRNV